MTDASTEIKIDIGRKPIRNLRPKYRRNQRVAWIDEETDKVVVGKFKKSPHYRQPMPAERK